MLDVTLSNSLTDLAARIKAEHEASSTAIKRGLEHAVACGRLLNEAKDQLDHGQWLPWLRDHCCVPVRTAQRYMELAIYAPDIKNDNLSYLAIDAAASSSVSIEKAVAARDFDTFAKIKLDGPFNALDFEGDFDWLHDWLNTKLTHQLNFPPIASWCVSVQRVMKENYLAFRLCPWEELAQSASLLAPLLAKKPKHKLPIAFDCASFASMDAMSSAVWVLKMHAMRLLGGIIIEIEHRASITDERYAKEWDKTHKHVRRRLDDADAPMTLTHLTYLLF